MKIYLSENMGKLFQMISQRISLTEVYSTGSTSAKRLFIFYKYNLYLYKYKLYFYINNLYIEKM